ncbi:hypothetical protein GINT2_000475 [Glugoides intestinalis]
MLISLLNAAFIVFDKRISRLSNTALDQIVKTFSAKKTQDLKLILTATVYSVIECVSKSVKYWIKPFFEARLGVLIESSLFKKYITTHFAHFYETGPTVNFIRVKTQTTAICNATSLLMFDFLYSFVLVLSSIKYFMTFLEAWVFCCFFIFLFFNTSLEIILFINLKRFRKAYTRIEEEKGKYLVEYIENLFITKLNNVDLYPGMQKLLLSDAHLKYNFFLETIKFQNSALMIIACAILFLNSGYAKLNVISTLLEFFNLTNGLSMLIDNLFLLESKRNILCSDGLEVEEFKKTDNLMISDNRTIEGLYLNVNLINISVYLKDLKVLHNINLNITSGEKLAFIGENGCGKTTFLRFLLGFLKSTGRIEINDENVSAVPEKLSISYLPQNIALNGTIYEELNINSKSNENLFAVAKAFGIDEFASSMSKGYQTPVSSLDERQKQLVKIAKYCTRKANILLADEPLCYLDDEYQSKIIDLILANTNQSVKLVVIHQREQGYRFDKIFHFSNSTIDVISPDEYMKRVSCP